MKYWGGFFNQNKAVSGATGASVEEIYPLALRCPDFVRSDILATYRKILTDCVERTHGLPDKLQQHLWDNCSVGEAPDGLITLLTKAMYDRNEIYIYFNSGTNVMRKATPQEAEQIKREYETTGKSGLGAYLSFKNFEVNDMLKIYSELEYGILRGLHKSVNVSRAVQIKIDQMRKSVALADAGLAVAQAQEIADGLRSGNDVLMDSADKIETTTPDVSPIEKAISFTEGKRAYYLGLPMSYISGTQTGGIGSTGEGDNRAVERGLKAFFYSILRPAILAIFGITVEFKSSDFRELDTALETAKTFELVSDTTLSRKAKSTILARVFNIDSVQEEKDKAAESAARGSDTSLNGAQVSAMSDFLAQLATGALAPDTAIQALMVSFSLSREDAEAIVEPMTNFRPRVVT